MRLLCCLALLIPVLVHAQNPDQPVSSRIEQVTVYHAGARVERFAETRLRPGTTDLVFGDLPPGLDAARIEVSAEGDFTLLGVTTRRDYADTVVVRPSIDRLRNRLRVIDDSLAVLRVLLDVLGQEQQLLAANQDLGPNTTVEQIRAAAAFYRERLTEIKTREIALRDRMAALTAERARVDGEIGQMTGQRVGRVPSAIVVTVSAPQAGTAQFRLRYVVDEAAWQPRYDARVEALDRALALTFNASVQQRTGEDWSRVRLTLSTGDPLARSTRPTLEPWRIGYHYAAPRPPAPQGRVAYGAYDPAPTTITGTVRDHQTGEPLPGANVILEGAQIGTTTDMAGQYRLDVPPGSRGTLRVNFIGYQSLTATLRSSRIDFFLGQDMMVLEDVVVTGAVRGAAAREAAAPPPIEQVDRVTTVEYVVNSPFTVPSDGRARVVEVQRLSLPATYAYYSAPRLDPAAYLMARLPDWDRHNLRSGEANLYLEGAFVGTTFLDAATASDTLTLSLGRDAGVIVERTQVDADRRRSFFGNRVEVARGYRITVRNTRNRRVEVVVEDQIPLSADGDITVSSDVNDGGTLDAETGIIRWTRTLAPGQSAVLTFSYSVRHPRGRTVRVD